MSRSRIRGVFATTLLAGLTSLGALQFACAQTTGPASAGTGASSGEKTSERTSAGSAAPHETITAAITPAITPAFAVPIANVPGKTMTALVVDYAPGGKSAPHRHGQAFVVGYVLSGEIRSRVDNGAEHVYRAGQSWTEKPGAHHRVSENASATEPAKLLAIFVADTNDKKLLTFDRK
ncbi:cupin domain-containing protein [Paraburkholderia sp. MMS20-SJTR3]|uniref:Cupin domain-containing protein n=1 Tax=Paraburkholderia sejongensis TaxID=2886946 RepID=A0ABS8JNL4_9BURK|nr:cupin domain-containing protein [Paraburkholderia sp. MMS20-SJTR3]MCC8391476.1 cupin domain-containing protein [Paraburkholderia sp. MMS20-SJTR3]